LAAPTPSDDLTFLELNASIDIMKMRVLVDKKLEDQGGLGFASQDSLILSVSPLNLVPTVLVPGRFNIPVRIQKLYIC
jgi:hypothetical protein